MTFIIAELGTNHMGDVNIAKKIIDIAVNAGCDAVKLQKKDVELIFEIKQLLYAEKFTLAGARKKLKQNKKKETQLNIAFDRDNFIELNEEIKKDLESILNILDKK